ncbi:hypothetical protein CVT24_004362 [Panaeolus cyanescens]|uniref:Uncharacterized protein n=1 Tax=Panaeolus cyanescens TaxID=181874 RepID=A0A409YBF9_9AGAR|nr:hypothetical protein CVT24_004362 [Panaeolus cyanescens]
MSGPLADAQALDNLLQSDPGNLLSTAGGESDKTVMASTSVVSLNSPHRLPTSPTTLSQSDAEPFTINDLPPEIIAKIFYIYMYWEDESHLIDPELEGMVSVFLPDPRSAPLLFCRVCRYWRNVAISTAALWSALAMKESFNLNTVELWLKRSQNHPLSLFLLIYSWDSWAHTQEQIPLLLDILYSTMPRWKSIFFHFPDTKRLRDLAFTLSPEEGKSSATQLQFLRISSQIHFSESDERLCIAAYHRLSSFPHPALRRFSWPCDCGTLDFANMPTVLWQNLQEVSLLTTTTGYLYPFLKACTTLRFMVIDTLHTFIWSGDVDVVTPTIAHALESLNIGRLKGYIAEAFGCLTTPKLKRLSYGHSAGGEETEALQDFLERSGCELESLCIVCKTSKFDEAEATIMLRTPIFTAIPNFSLRLKEDGCDPSFAGSIIAETVGRWSATTYARYEPNNRSYHLGWGTLDIAYDYNDYYPFLVKGPVPIPKWTLSYSDGPLTSA